jgi:hypothetical protein
MRKRLVRSPTAIGDLKIGHVLRGWGHKEKRDESDSFFGHKMGVGLFTWKMIPRAQRWPIL